MYKILYILRKLLGKMDLSPKDHGINEGSFDDLIKGLTILKRRWEILIVFPH